MSKSKLSTVLYSSFVKYCKSTFSPSKSTTLTRIQRKYSVEDLVTSAQKRQTHYHDVTILITQYKIQQIRVGRKFGV